MLKVIAEDFIKPEYIETVLPLYRELISATKKEPHCIAYDLYIDEKDPGHFIFIEEWPNHAARSVMPFSRSPQPISSFSWGNPPARLHPSASSKPWIWRTA